MKYIRRLLILVAIFSATIILLNKTNYVDEEEYLTTEIALTDTTNETKVDSSTLVDDNEVATLDDSKITGENLTFDTNFYPYYGMLNDNEKSLYKQIYANATNLQDSFIPISNITKDELTHTIESVYNDHPELFYLDSNYSYKYTSKNKIVQITLKYNQTKDNVNEITNSINKIVNNVISEANKQENDYEKEKYVHDYIINTTKYNTNASLNQTIYSTLINKETVCAGYARTFQYIMQKMNIPTYFVVGDSNGSHAWNIIKINNIYYNVDLTWDDTSYNHYKYFNVTDSFIESTHSRKNDSQYLPKCTTDYDLKQETTTKSVKDNVNNNEENNTKIENNDIDNLIEIKNEEEKNINETNENNKEEQIEEQESNNLEEDLEIQDNNTNEVAP